MTPDASNRPQPSSSVHDSAIQQDRRVAEYGLDRRAWTQRALALSFRVHTLQDEAKSYPRDSLLLFERSHKLAERFLSLDLRLSRYVQAVLAVKTEPKNKSDRVAAILRVARPTVYKTLLELRIVPTDLFAIQTPEEASRLALGGKMGDMLDELRACDARVQMLEAAEEQREQTQSPA